MNDPEIEFITSCATTLQQTNNHSQIMEILKQLQYVNMSINTLKSTRIGAIVNKLTKRKNLPSKIHTFAWELVNNWKEIVTVSVTLEQKKIQPQSESYASNTNKKRSFRSLSLSPDPICTQSNTNNSLNPSKKQRISHRNTSMFAGLMNTNNGPKTVPTLQQICINVMKQNAVKLGTLPCELNGKIIQQIYSNLKPSELKKIYRLNPNIRHHLDVLWRRQLMNLNPNYIKHDSNMSWFKAYQLYLLQRKDKYETAKQRLLMKSQEAKYQKQSTTKLLSKQEATAFKAVNKRNRKGRKKYQSKNQIKKNKMMKDCMSFVKQRNRMFKAAQKVNNTRKINVRGNNSIGLMSSKQKSFIRRQKELRAKRNDEKNRVCQW